MTLKIEPKVLEVHTTNKTFIYSSG